ncbi:MAG: epoxyqueuosine reductase QueH [Treponema sp.]|jgi:tRNA A37 threonylcarbamoyladenosine dehydratase/predicted adenine nucleotide alpha hydrolase (AANH) superfamily ATPase|nr:epoxyqueuosine reductase QueH [Treponema sp.]
MKLLFHCCCGPCAAACVESLRAESIHADGIHAESMALKLFWYNPNIHPCTEYQNRRDAFIRFAAAHCPEPEIIDKYGLRSFLQDIGRATEAPERCEVCYRLRLEQTAAHAAKNGFDAFSTSLLASPYQRHDTIRRIGEELAAGYGVVFLYRDFRPLFRQGQAQARALGLYMQKYCGCVFSEEERYAQRQDVSLDKKQHGESPAFNPLFQRLALITGAEVLEKLARTKVLIFGLGGVGSWCAEALVRSGIGKIGIVDFDTICASNVNRQVQATSRTLGLSKAETLKARLLEIHPNCEVSAWGKVFSRESAADFSIETADYVIDAIDSLTHKLDLIEISCAASASKDAGVTLFSSMGMALKMDPTRVKTAGIWETEGCPLARLVRQGLRKRGFSGNFTAVYSDEDRIECHGEIAAADSDSDNASDNGHENNPYSNKVINGSAVTVTAAAGMILASLVLRDIVKRHETSLPAGKG